MSNEFFKYTELAQQIQSCDGSYLKMGVLMKNATWLQKLESELEYKKVLMIYGNVKDFYFYDGKFYKTLEELIKNLKFGLVSNEFFTYTELAQQIQSCDGSNENPYSHTKQFGDLIQKKATKDSKRIVLVKNPELFLRILMD